MNKKSKDIGTGIGVAGISILASTNIIPGVGVCTGVCGACGLTCLVPIAGLSSALFLSVIRKKFKSKKS